MNPILEQIETLKVSLDTFVYLLQRESDCLTQKDPDTLAQILDEKNQVTDSLGQQWEQLCQALGLPNVPHDILEGRIVELGDRAINDIWRTVNHLSQQAKKLNEQNGAVIRLQLLQTNKAIEILQSASRQNSVYGPDGLSDSHLAYTRTIDKA